MQKSQAEIDAIELLRLMLEEAFNKSATDCATQMIEYLNSPGEIDVLGRSYLPHGGEPIIAVIINAWREKSLECITSGFDRLLQAMPSALNSKAARDRAAELTWEAIDGAYGWENGRRQTGKFKEWFRNAQAVDDRNQPLDFDLPLRFTECRGVSTMIHVQLNCDFRHMFETRLAALRLGAQPGGSVSRPPPSTSDAKTAQDTVAIERWYYNESLSVRNSEISTPARWKLVDDIKEEIQQYRAELSGLRSNFQKLAHQYQRCITFDIYARATRDKRVIFDICISERRYEDLACELAGDLGGGGASAMKKAWSDYRRAQSIRG